LDKHSRAGRKLGRRNSTALGINHFYDVSAKLKNEPPAIDNPYKESARQTALHNLEKRHASGHDYGLGGE